MKMKICRHCGGSIIETNPMGYCEHTLYPKYCNYCYNKGYRENNSLEVRALGSMKKVHVLTQDIKGFGGGSKPSPKPTLCLNVFKEVK
jgi:hypothetical protein